MASSCERSIDEMSNFHRQILQNNRRFIEDNILLVEKFWSYLLQTGTLTEDIMEEYITVSI